jgi:hypothetical protein
LATVRDIRPNPLPHEAFVAAFVTNLNGHGAIPLQFLYLGEEMVGQSALEFRGSIGSE